MASLRIVLLCVLAAVVYGITQDQVTARVCVEYFTIGHPPLFETSSPTLLAIGWGTVATWWVGLPLGLILAVAARAGREPRRSARDLVRPIACLLMVVGTSAMLAGVAGWVAARSGAITLAPSLAERVPRDRHAAFLADGAAHLAAYFVGALGGVVLGVRVWLARRREVKEAVAASAVS